MGPEERQAELGRVAEEASAIAWLTDRRFGCTRAGFAENPLQKRVDAADMAVGLGRTAWPLVP